MQLREIVTRIAHVCGWTLRADPDGLVVDVPTGGGRGQLVAIVEDRDLDDQPVARYWSVIGDADRVDYRKCLEENTRLSSGAFAIQAGKLCLMETQRILGVDPVDVAASIGRLAATADRYENELFGTDQY